MAIKTAWNRPIGLRRPPVDRSEVREDPDAQNVQLG